MPRSCHRTDRVVIAHAFGLSEICTAVADCASWKEFAARASVSVGRGGRESTPIFGARDITASTVLSIVRACTVADQGKIAKRTRRSRCPDDREKSKRRYLLFRRRTSTS